MVSAIGTFLMGYLGGLLANRTDDLFFKKRKNRKSKKSRK